MRARRDRSADRGRSTHDGGRAAQFRDLPSNAADTTSTLDAPDLITPDDINLFLKKKPR
jgi:hypothetical protein